MRTTWPRLAAGLAVGLMLWTGTALGQGRPACDQQGKVKTAEKIEGQVIKIDIAQLQDLKVGSRVEAKLREAPNC